MVMHIGLLNATAVKNTRPIWKPLNCHMSAMV